MLAKMLLARFLGAKACTTAPVQVSKEPASVSMSAKFCTFRRANNILAFKYES